MAIEAGAARPWGDRERWATSWYEPGDGGTVERGVRFALSVAGVHAVCTPGDLAVLRQRSPPPRRSRRWTRTSGPPPSTPSRARR